MTAHKQNEIQQEQNPGPSPEVAGFFAGCSEGRRFTVHEIIGKGSYGLVCSATDNFTGQRVAIKKIQNVFDNVADATRILREITLLRLLKHIDIVDIHHILLPSDQLSYKDIYLVFELFESDLHTVIGANDDLTADHVKVFLYQLIRGLAYIHQSGVLHRDLKPRNILANSNCKLKICDFGLARSFVPQSQDVATAVYWTDYVATRWYRAPELCGCFYGHYSQAVDIWSLGCIFAEILQGKPLFPGRDAVSQLNLITDLLGKPSHGTIERVSNRKAREFLHKMPPKAGRQFDSKFPNVDPLALDLLKTMLAFDPAERPTAAEALQHSYFQKLPPVCLKDVKSINKDNFDFEPCQLTEKDVRELIYIEILHYHPHHQALYAQGYNQMSMLVEQYGCYPGGPSVPKPLMAMHQPPIQPIAQQLHQMQQPGYQHTSYDADAHAPYLQQEVMYRQHHMHQHPGEPVREQHYPDGRYSTSKPQHLSANGCSASSPVGSYLTNKMLAA